ncbi:MAG: bifunctional oligoribonuclease/PAP phosphatase NrnA [Clostridia bacterium]|nr:bifunctional oligoribonuclease/PAP phosphatase NrnA [Clostridia bacterium]
MTLDDILEEINKAESIVILTHENPDGDAVGSSLALYNALKNYGKQNVDVIIPEYSRCFEFLPGTNIIKKESDVEHYDLAISVDTATIKMLNGWAKYFDNAKTSIVIDHHGTNTMYGDLNFVNPDSPACAQILLVLFGYYNMEITKEIGTCILTGIITDTGGFKYQGTNVETFEFVAELLNKGVNVSKIYRRVLETTTRTSFELRRIAESRLEFLFDNKATFTYITLDDEDKVKSETGDHEGIVNIGKCIEGVEVSVFIRELRDGKGWKVSLRSNEYVNVSDVALLFGGGGHPRAAGCNMQGDLQHVRDKIMNEVRACLK